MGNPPGNYDQFYVDDVSFSKTVPHASGNLSFTYGDPYYGPGLYSLNPQYFAVTAVSNNGHENKTIVPGQNATLEGVVNTPTKTVFSLDKMLVKYQNIPPSWIAVSGAGSDLIRLPVDENGDGQADLNPDLVVGANDSYDGHGAIALSFNAGFWGSCGFGDSLSVVNGKDLSGYDTLVFWVKGVFLNSAVWPGVDDEIRPAQDYLSVSFRTIGQSDLTPKKISFDGNKKEWQKISIPLSEFGNPYFGLDKIQYFTMTFLENTRGTIMIDKVAVEKRKEKEAQEGPFEVKGVYPKEGATGVGLTPEIKISFSHYLKSIGSGIRIRKQDSTNTFIFTNGFTISKDCKSVSLDLKSLSYNGKKMFLDSGSVYEVTVSSNAEDSDSNLLGSSYSWSFTTKADVSIGDIKIKNRLFNPDLMTDNEISVQVSAPDLKCKAVLYTTKGIPVAGYPEDASTQDISTEKKILLTGKDSAGNSLKPGIYILEINVADGKAKAVRTIAIK
jgi:hypothetical protein